MTGTTSFDALVAEALQQELVGWDFSYLEPRWLSQPTSWDYPALARQKIAQAQTLLDMGTGGGEMLASLAPLPPHSFATESYPPNIPVARARLEPMGVQVAATRLDQDILPFENDFFDLVLNRHESFSAAEVQRVLKPGGCFLTQQVGGRDNLHLNELLQDQVSFEFSAWTLQAALQQIERAGLHVTACREEFPETRVLDIGAVVFYLKAIPWQIADFSIEKYRPRLIKLHEQIEHDGCLLLHAHRFMLEAHKPTPP